MVLLKKFGKFILWFFLALIAYFALYFLFTLILTLIPVNRNFKEAPDGVELFIISNGVHTDICFPVRAAHLDWDRFLDFGLFETPRDSIGYLSFGWGDKGFYFDTPSWAELSVKTALTAAFLPSPTAMHVSLLSTKPELGERTKKVRITSAQLEKIEQYIYATFQTDQGKSQAIDCCRYEGYDDYFYEAQGSYHMLRTCNVWANQCLKRAGIKTASWAPFDRCILYHF